MMPEYVCIEMQLLMQEFKPEMPVVLMVKVYFHPIFNAKKEDHVISNESQMCQS